MHESRSIPIICYHSIDESDSVISVSPKSFALQMRHLKALGYQAVSLREITDYVHKGFTTANRPIGIIFDDGYKNNYTEAFPVLQEVGFTATIFITTDYCGQINAWGPQHGSIPRLPMMTWNQIEELSRQGIEIGSHTKSHPKLSELGMDKIRDELVGAKALLEDRIGKNIEFASYPYGNYNETVKQIAKSYFKAVVSTRVGKVRKGSDPHALKRLNASGKLFKMFSPKMIYAGSLSYYIAVKTAMNKFKSLMG
jgi:peptidoglycan/xylan/chitin deacetylase (PgdA/CDA1 family)